MTEVPTRREARRSEASRRPVRRRRPVSIVGVLGELLITAGVFVGLFLGWQLWLNNIIVGNEIRGEAHGLQQEWAAGDDAVPNPDATDDPATEEPEASGPVTDGFPIATAPAHLDNFANLIVPRWGEDYLVTIAEGTDWGAVLNSGRIGHYESTVMPGDVGNFALAAHRTTYNMPFRWMADLRPGDHLYVETADGWYQYEFRNLEYVRPTGVGVVAPVPQVPDATPTDRIMTLTSCNPLHSAAERIIGYTTFDQFWPRTADGGVPPEIAYSVGGA